jgi:hypothetical protein
MGRRCRVSVCRRHTSFGTEALEEKKEQTAPPSVKMIFNRRALSAADLSVYVCELQK